MFRQTGCESLSPQCYLFIPECMYDSQQCGCGLEVLHFKAVAVVPIQISTNEQHINSDSTGQRHNQVRIRVKGKTAYLHTEMATWIKGIQ